MSDAIELVGLVVTNAEQNILLLHRSDHNQWQLPGGRKLFGELAVEAAARHALQELNIEVLKQRYLGFAAFSQGGVDYKCEWHQATEWNNDPILGDWGTYDDAEYHNLFKRDIASIGVSPNVDSLITALHLGVIDLTDD